MCGINFPSSPNLAESVAMPVVFDGLVLCRSFRCRFCLPYDAVGGNLKPLKNLGRELQPFLTYCSSYSVKEFEISVKNED